MKSMRALPFLKTTLLALMLAFSTTAWAQDDEGDGENEATPVEQEGPKRVSGVMGFFMPGFGMRDLSALNTYTGNTEFSDNGFSLGGGGVLMIRSFMLGGEGASFLDDKTSVGNTAMNLQSGWGKGTLGYVVYGRKGLLIYPKVGFGAYNESLTFEKTNGSTSVDSIFTGNYSNTNLSKNGLLLSFGAGFEWMPGFDETAGSGLVFGFDAGYNMAVSEGNWYSLDSKLYGGPSVTPTGIFVNLHIGFGGWNRQ